MEKSNRKNEPYQTLKQMSIRRQNLEKSSAKLQDDLEQLQHKNVEQEARISSSLVALRQEQEITEELLKISGMDRGKLEQASYGFEGNSLPARPVKREPSILRQLRTWTTSDVVQWLEQKNLHKFSLLFQKHRVTGSDLADLNLPALEKYEHITVEDREQLLAEVYDLLRLELSDDEDLSRISTPVQIEKYKVAKQIAQDPVYQRSQSMPVAFITSQSSSSSSSSSTTSSPTPKQRKKSTDFPRGTGHSLQRSGGIRNPHRESDSNIMVKTNTEKKMLKRNSLPNSWFDALSGSSNPCVSCTVLQKRGSHFDVSIDTRPDGQLVIDQVRGDANHNILVGDRVLEINGLSCLSSKQPAVTEILGSSDVLKLVTCRPNRSDKCSDKKWQKLRDFLLDFQDQEIDVEEMMKEIPKQDLQNLKTQAALKIDLDGAMSRISEQQTLIEKLSEDLDEQKSCIQHLVKEREGVTKSRLHKTESGSKKGETEYYKITMESLNVENASKEEIMASLKQIVKEASRQKFYLDRLISLVIEESPWLLDQVDANFDEVSFDSQTEEFC